MDFNKVLDASKMILVILLAFNLIFFGVQVGLALLGVGAGAVAGKDAGAVAGILAWIAEWGVRGIIVIGNIAIIGYGGYSAAKKGNDLVGCGLVGLLCYAVVGLIIGVLQTITGLLGVGGSVVTSGNAATGAIMGLFGAIGLGVGIICGIGWYLAGLVVNFLLALVGGAVGGAK